MIQIEDNVPGPLPITKESMLSKLHDNLENLLVLATEQEFFSSPGS